ncbi:hypothetical protein KY329_04525 [Candidatus Woesearchaeota archaeon]|nr:hypothetical protein [Candidatus Woesearchaeota archaeon]
MYSTMLVKQGFRYWLSSLKQRFKHKIYKGNAAEICRQIVEDNWNGTYFTTSTHHYREFWARDTGLVSDALIKLGYRKQLKSTLNYALKKYSAAGEITTTITREGKAYSFPNLYSPDSTALLVYAIIQLKDNEIVNKYDKFLQKITQDFANKVLDNGRVKPIRFSSMRDYAINTSSCYNHCMAILMAKNAQKLKYRFPYTAKELTKILQEYWTGQYYKDDRENDVPTADANTLPYWVGAGKHFDRALKTIRSLRLDKPIPLAYTNTKQKMILADMFVPNWEQNNCWPMIGLPFIKLVKQPKLAREYEKKYKGIIERYGTLYEVYTKKSTPYKSIFYHADEGMIWAANYLHLRFVRTTS